MKRSGFGARRVRWGAAGGVVPLAVLCLFFGVADADDDLQARYARAAAWQDHDRQHFVLNSEVLPSWIAGTDTFWYPRQTDQGKRYVVFDAAKGTRVDAFDHAALASQLAAATGKSVSPDALPLQDLWLQARPRVATFSAFGKSWHYDVARQHLTEDTGTTRDRQSLLISPDGARALFLKDSNLWVRNLATGEERALTTDGVKYNAYGSLPSVMGIEGGRPQAMWSPDSRRVFTAQVDDREVLELPSLDFAPANGSVRPLAHSVRGALPGDEHITRYRLVILDATTGQQVVVRNPTLPAVRMILTPFGDGRAWWSADGATAYVVEIERGERTARLLAIDAATGATHALFEEQAEHYLEFGTKVFQKTSIVPLPATNEVIWYSERSGWAHLYLYDLRTGALKRPLTSGDWLVRDVIGVDAARREVYLTIAGRVPGRDPYYRELVKVGLDTGKLTILSSSDADHKSHSVRELDPLVQDGAAQALSGLSPSGAYLVETVTRIDGPSRTRVLRRDGSPVAVVEEADASRLPAGWKWPEPVMLKAADGKTDIAAAIFRPSDFSPNRRYPVIDCIYGGPQVSIVPESYLGTLAYLESVSLAELGFVVVVVDGRGTAERSRAFHEASYGAIQTSSNLEDHIAAIRQLGARYPYLDLDHVGISGFSAGGYMAALAMLRYPDFFKVGVARSGNYDQRLFWYVWGERYHGMLEGDNYVAQAARTYAANLKGKLMFIHGLADPGVHPAALFQVTQALIEAGKDFEMTLMPRAGHEINGWAQRRQWDFLVRNLAGQEPPPPVAHKSEDDLLNEQQ